MTQISTLLRIHRERRGLFSRVAKHLGLDPSYVSRVASGQRKNKRIMKAIEAELNKIDVASRRIAKSARKKSGRSD